MRVAAGLNRPSGDVPALVGPVGIPAQAVDGAEWKSACPVSQAGHVPAADEGVGQFVRAAGKEPAATEGQGAECVDSDGVTRIVVGWTAIASGLVHVDDLAEVPAIRRGRGPGAFCIRAQINGLGERVIGVKLHPVGFLLVQRKLQPVVAAGAHRRPHIQ